jgi:nitrite reductase/ring-hydroxylating ferredoxin subunit
MATEFDFGALENAAKEGRGLFIPKNSSHPALTVCLDLKYGSIYAVEDACPHAGHSLSGGDQLKINDIEDLAPGCNLGTILACPAHAFIYDMKSGYCLSNPDGGRYAERWEVIRNGSHFTIGNKFPKSMDVPRVTKEQSDKIQLMLVGQALDRKYGNNTASISESDEVLTSSTTAANEPGAELVASEEEATVLDDDDNNSMMDREGGTSLSEGLKNDEEAIKLFKDVIDQDIDNIDLSVVRNSPNLKSSTHQSCTSGGGSQISANDAINQLKADISNMNNEIVIDSLLLKPRSYIFESRIETANLLRQKGNEHFKRAAVDDTTNNNNNNNNHNNSGNNNTGDKTDVSSNITACESAINSAIECYDRALYHVDFDEAQMFDLGDKHVELLNAEKVPLHLNKALCLSKLAKLADVKKRKHQSPRDILQAVLEEVELVLKLDGKHYKALMLKGKTLVNIGRPKQGLDVLTTLLEVITTQQEDDDEEDQVDSKKKSVTTNGGGERLNPKYNRKEVKEVQKIIKATKMIVKKDSLETTQREKDMWQGKLALSPPPPPPPPSAHDENVVAFTATANTATTAATTNDETVKTATTSTVKVGDVEAKEEVGTNEKQLNVLGWLPLVLFMAMFLFKVLRGDFKTVKQEL